MSSKLDCTGLFVTVSNPGVGVDKSNECPVSFTALDSYVTVSNPGWGGGPLTRAMKCLASLTALNSGTLCSLPPVMPLTVSNPDGGGPLNKSNEMFIKLECTGLFVTVSNRRGGPLDKSNEMSSKLDCTGLCYCK